MYALGRFQANVAFADRVKASLDDIAGTPVERDLLANLHCLEIDIADPGLGLSRPITEVIPASNAILFHVAGDTRFNPANPESQRQINIDGSLNVMHTLRGSIDYAVHVSTAYVAGDRKGLVLESELDQGQTFRNCYEQSKLDAEIGIADLCGEIDLPLCVVRPSIIINDTATGRSSTFTHLNALVEVINRIQQHYQLGDGEAISEKIRIPIAPDARPNLAPIDSIVDAMLEIGLRSPAAGRTYHLCHPCPQSNAEIVSLLAQAFGVHHLIRMSFVSALPENPTWTEKMMIRSLKPYLPYLNESCVFDLTNTRSVIPDYDSRFPALILEYIQRVIEFQRSLA